VHLQSPGAGEAGGRVVAHRVVVARQAVPGPQVDAPPRSAVRALPRRVVAYELAAHHALRVREPAARAACCHLRTCPDPQRSTVGVPSPEENL
jgi:hypothetical protein